MPKLFGTDGVRGIANQDLTPELAFKLGEAGARKLALPAGKLVVGRDTRQSGDLLESALIAGVCAAGADAVLLGIVPTPAVAYLTRAYDAQGGVVISASHNPAEYNGIKFFDADGIKLSEEAEEDIERLLDGEAGRPMGAGVGAVSTSSTALADYERHLETGIDGDLSGLSIVVDGANGAASVAAPAVLRRLGASVTAINCEPDGMNINAGCGSTHPDALCRAVVDRGASVGLAFDGDADRLIAVDERGDVVDGDYIMAMCADYLNDRGQLEPRALVTTVMTNMGFDVAMRQRGIAVVKTAVGDRYVLQEMLSKGIKIGGEQSGHIIFMDHNTTGDGLVTALQLLRVVRDTGRPLSLLRQVMSSYPQILVNLEVSNGRRLSDSPRVRQVVGECTAELGDTGRVLVRPSGTEPLVRVMVESQDAEVADRIARRICGAIEAEIG